MKPESANPPFLLWFDRTRDRSAEALVAHFRPTCECRIAKNASLSELAAERQPDMVCIHYDRPDMPGLNLLLEIKHKSPSIPIAMFTVQHSEELAVWAMRSRVWEYIVLPLCNSEKSRFLHALQQLCELRRSTHIHAKKPLIEHGPSLPDSIRLTAEHHKHQALSNVLLYIDQHLRDSIDQKELAKRCGMTTFRFSRLFKEVNGVGFMEYILSKRMDFARELLDNSQMPITSIGYEVGFKDPSYFARAFKQFVGCTPSEYRQLPRAESSGAESTSTEALSEVVESLRLGANR
ncbi:response regulator transcription factor [Pseudomonas wadenswilerensis]|jgi:AraC-like DNA-binding protein|uniref:Regulatory protein PocR n=1 Tax=Pseudomonas wadenswilerensis TaxID=1785161 RepID=A0A380SYI8_9PSED|nr:MULTISPECIES: response regulator transcription factor [Pseudomonas]MCE5983712.1 response regulator transcription factor [Pseudomonas sp. LF19]UVM19474.1 response regulator transcription factor [Pseudomonas wadenswilerensis]SPO69155.1 DNA-binding domain-containing protein, AraC-type [Pseudomonas sp. JV241A]SUQ63072.1 Regulatory protein PocR [Pseudomonas wadenswilerensis]